MRKLKTEEKPMVEAEHPTPAPAKKENSEKQGEPVKIARTATQLASGQGNTSRRAEMSGAMQGMVGNERLGQMMNADQASSASSPNATIQRQKDKSKKDPPAITTPLPKGAIRQPSGAAEFQVVALKVVVLSDKYASKPIIDRGKRRSAKTDITLNWKLPGAQHKDGKITSISTVSLPVLTIQTTYGLKSTPGMKSTYGKGTTSEDIKAGKTTLGFHEGSHGEYAIQYARDHPLPIFTGKLGMTVDEFNQAISDYDAAMESYKQQLLDYQMQMTDCVGTKADFCVDTER
jgi:hypothetical protein